MILLENDTKSLLNFISAKKFLEDKLEFSNYNNKNKNIRNKRKRIIELTIDDVACFVKPYPDFVCDTIVRGILPKRHNGLISNNICFGY